VQFEPRDIHIINILGRIKRRQLHSQATSMYSLNTRCFTRLIETFQSFVSK